MQRKDWNTAALAASERSGEAANAAGSPAMDQRQLLPDSEVTARPQRRRFTAEYKRSIVDEADAAQDAGAVGGLLRREGLYSSHLSTWRRQRRQGELEAMAPKRRGPKVVVSPLHLENRKLLAINIRLTQRLKNAELIIESAKKSSCLAGQPDSEDPDRRGERMSAALQLGQRVGQAAACRALGVPRASLYRSLQPVAASRPRPTPARALNPRERKTVLHHLHSERFCDKAPLEVYATLLDEGVYLCSVRTMHRILAENGELKERRNQLRHPQYQKPELLATAPNQVWSWDITKLLGPAKWT